MNFYEHFYIIAQKKPRITILIIRGRFYSLNVVV